MLGLDSAFGPTLTQAKMALETGYKWWGWYVGGPGAYHVWTDAEVEVLKEAGFKYSLPIWVPSLDLKGDARRDYELAHSRAEALGWKGPVALDTEASMRENGWLKDYVDTWCRSAIDSMVPAVVYGGGNYVGIAFPWWIVARSNPRPTECFQTGQTRIGEDGGLNVDLNISGSNFPLCKRVEDMLGGDRSGQKGSKTMWIFRYVDQSKGFFITDGVTKRWLESSDEIGAFQFLGVQVVVNPGDSNWDTIVDEVPLVGRAPGNYTGVKL